MQLKLSAFQTISLGTRSRIRSTNSHELCVRELSKFKTALNLENNSDLGDVCKLREPDSIISINYLFPLCWQINESRGRRPGWKHETLYTSSPPTDGSRILTFELCILPSFLHNPSVKTTRHFLNHSKIFKWVLMLTPFTFPIPIFSELLKSTLDFVRNLNGFRKHVTFQKSRSWRGLPVFLRDMSVVGVAASFPSEQWLQHRVELNFTRDLYTFISFPLQQNCW